MRLTWSEQPDRASVRRLVHSREGPAVHVDHWFVTVGGQRSDLSTLRICSRMPSRIRRSRSSPPGRSSPGCTTQIRCLEWWWGDCHGSSGECQQRRLAEGCCGSGLPCALEAHTVVSALPREYRWGAQGTGLGWRSASAASPGPGAHLRPPPRRAVQGQPALSAVRLIVRCGHAAGLTGHFSGVRGMEGRIRSGAPFGAYHAASRSSLLLYNHSQP
jgi:hypothetical protein